MCLKLSVLYDPLSWVVSGTLSANQGVAVHISELSEDSAGWYIKGLGVYVSDGSSGVMSLSPLSSFDTLLDRM